MEAEVKRLEAKTRAAAAGNAQWANACEACGCELVTIDAVACDRCRQARDAGYPTFPTGAR